jgi:hypothetical protein
MLLDYFATNLHVDNATVGCLMIQPFKQKKIYLIPYIFNFIFHIFFYCISITNYIIILLKRSKTVTVNG